MVLLDESQIFRVSSLSGLFHSRQIIRFRQKIKKKEGRVNPSTLSLSNLPPSILPMKAGIALSLRLRRELSRTLGPQAQGNCERRYPPHPKKGRGHLAVSKGSTGNV
jgi:hypothetical protein